MKCPTCGHGLHFAAISFRKWHQVASLCPGLYQKTHTTYNVLHLQQELGTHVHELFILKCRLHSVAGIVQCVFPRVHEECQPQLPSWGADTQILLLLNSCWYPCHGLLQELCLPECFFKASLMVMKFFSDLDILQPAIVRWPVCKKYLTQQSFSK